MEITYMNFFADVKAEVERHDPGHRFDMGGTQPPNGWTGMDYWLLSKFVDLPAIYDLEQVGEIVRSFRSFVHKWYGYSNGGESLRYQIWLDAFRFLDFGVSYYHEGLMLLPDYTIPEPVRAASEAWKDLQDGGARLLRSLTEDPAALIHYSHSSTHAAQIEERHADFLAARERWINRLIATGTPFRFVAYAEIEDGELDRTPAKTVILPASSALSDREVEALRLETSTGGSGLHPVKVEFLDDAGRTLATDMAEVRNGSGTWRNKAPKAALVVFTDFVSKKGCVLK